MTEPPASSSSTWSFLSGISVKSVDIPKFLLDLGYDFALMELLLSTISSLKDFLLFISKPDSLLYCYFFNLLNLLSNKF